MNSDWVLSLDTSERTESTVHGNDGAIDETAGRAAQPDQRAHQLVGLAEPAGRGMLDDTFPPRGKAPIIIDEELAVLFPDEESRCDGVDSQTRSVLARELNREPSGKVLHGRFPGRICRYPSQGTLRGH